MDRGSQLSKDDEDDKDDKDDKEDEEDEEEKEEKEEEKEDEEATDIKSNNPHLAGGGKKPFRVCIHGQALKDCELSAGKSGARN